jgi:hypothetical protein
MPPRIPRPVAFNVRRPHGCASHRFHLTAHAFRTQRAPEILGYRTLVRRRKLRLGVSMRAVMSAESSLLPCRAAADRTPTPRTGSCCGCRSAPRPGRDTSALIEVHVSGHRPRGKGLRAVAPADERLEGIAPATAQRVGQLERRCASKGRQFYFRSSGMRSGAMPGGPASSQVAPVTFP